MRLTLRTMLAFLDDILKPADAEDLRRKIDDSEFAKGLVHRIRTSTRRAKLGAPTLDGKGMGLDPNTVAEYLDNVLPPDRVPEFEKICLESDVHLAEAASCHQILALVLGEAANVAPELRDRCYRIGAPDTTRVANRADTADSVERLDGSGTLAAPPVAVGNVHGSALAEPAAPPASGEADVPAAIPAAKRRRTVVPDYLRAGKRAPWKSMAITLALVFLLVLAILRAMGPLDNTHPVAKWMGFAAPGEIVADGSEAVPEDGPTRPEQAPAAPPQSPEPGSDAGQAAPPKEDETAVPEDVLESKKPPAGTDTAGSSGKAVTGAAEEGGETVEEGTEPEVSPDTAAPEFPATEPMAPEDAADAELADKASGKEPVDPSAVAEDEAPAAPVPPVEVGYVKESGRHFLLRRDAASGNWFRLPGRAKLNSGDELAVLPTYRPEFVLQPAVQVVCAGPTRARPLPPSEQGDPGLSLLHGHAFVSTAGVAGARLQLDLGGDRATVIFAEPDSEIAVDVARYLPPGSDPLSGETTPVIHVFATMGSIEWQDDASPPSTISSGQVRLVFGDRSETMTASGAPPWMAPEEPGGIERLASQDLEPMLSEDRPAILALKEQAGHRRSEIRSLAARSLAFLGYMEALIAEFTDEQQRAYWSAEFTALREAVTYSPTAAASIRATLETYHGEQAAELFQMICGYSPQQLIQGADARLVERLDDKTLIARVFAFENLRRITGKTHYYQPWLSEARRRSSVQDWRTELDEGNIRYANPPGPTIYGK